MASEVLWRSTIDGQKALWSGGKESFVGRKALYSLYRSKGAFALTVLVVAAVSAIYLLLRPAVYTAEVTVLVRPLPLAPTVTAGPQALSFSEESAAIRSDVVADGVIDTLELNSSVQELQAGIDVTLASGGAAAQAPTPSSLVLRISYEGTTAVDVPPIATTVARRYIAVRGMESQRVLQAAQEATNEAIEDLTARVEEVSADLDGGPGGRNPASEASLTSSLNTLLLELETLHQRAAQLQPNEVVQQGGARVLQAPKGTATPTLTSWERIAYPLLLGIVAGFLVVSWLERRRDRFVMGKEIEALGPPVLAWIPAGTGAEDPVRTSGFLHLRNAIVARLAADRPKSIAIASPTDMLDHGVAQALAVYLAEVGYRTALVASDGEGQPSSALTVATWPPTDAGRGLPSLARLTSELKNARDYVVVEAPPLLDNADGEMAALTADVTVVVVDAKHARRADLVAAIKKIEELRRPILGTVVNSADSLFDHRLPRRGKQQKKSRSRRRATPASSMS